MPRLAISISAGFLGVVPSALTAPLALAQTSTAAEAPSAKFDEVSIRLANASTDRETIDSPVGGDGIAIKNMTAEEIVELAYDFHRRESVSGLPEWATTQHYDAVAKVADAEVTAFRKLTPAQRKMMLQLVLPTRFGLKAHRARKEMPIFALVVTKSGPKMKEAKPGDTYFSGAKLADGSPAGAGTLAGLTGQGVTMAALAVTLSGSTSGVRWWTRLA